MAISIYCGASGSGKSYSAVKEMALPAAKAGRVIVTNIKGIDPEYWAEQLGCDAENIWVRPDTFFQEDANYPLMNVREGVIPAGALLLIDEAHSIFPPGRETSPERVKFLMEHRHFVGPDGVAMDVLFITQDVMSLHPRVRGNCEFVCRYRNLRHLGMAKRYRVQVYTSPRMNKDSFTGDAVHKYDVATFKFYKSFEADGAAKVVMTDKRQSVFKKKHLLFGALIVGCLGYAASSIGGAVDALDAKAIGHQEGVTVERPILGAVAPSYGAKAPCVRSGIMLDLETGEWFDGENWQTAYRLADGSWDVGSCIIRPG